MPQLPIKIELTTEDQLETIKWVLANFHIFNQARKVRLGRIILDVNKDGRIKTKYEISGDDMNVFFINDKSEKINKWRDGGKADEEICRQKFGF